MILIEFFIPLADNAGEPFETSDFDAFEQGLLASFGGFSKLPGVVAGAWRDGEVTFRDHNVVYAVAIPSLLDGGKVGGMVRVAKVLFRQEAIFIRYLGQAEIV